MLLQFQIYLFIWFFFPKCVTEGLVLFSQPIPPFVSSWIWLIFLQVHSLIFLSDMPFKQQRNSFLKMLCLQLQLFCLLLSSLCLSLVTFMPSFESLSTFDTPVCICIVTVISSVSVISSPPWLLSPGSSLHCPVQSLLVVWWVLDTLTVAIYEIRLCRAPSPSVLGGSVASGSAMSWPTSFWSSVWFHFECMSQDDTSVTHLNM